jgi:hypothetical protein
MRKLWKTLDSVNSRMDSFLETISLSETESFPVFRNLWDFFSSKGNKTIFLSIGESASPMVELHLSETLGCKVHLLTENPEYQQKWTEIQSVLKTRKATEQTSEFAKQALRKWVLPTSICVSSAPCSFSTMKSTVSSICSGTGVDERVDILKIDATTSKLAETLYSILHNGYRPGILMIHWETSPDSTLETTLLAGHLQNIGYGLVAKSKNNYLYYFTDKNIYEMCSWETSESPNPLVAKFMELVQVKNQEKE